jgi:hypothetical protein
VCPPSYEGVHCHARTRICERNACKSVDNQTESICRSFPSDRALSYYCECRKEINDHIKLYFAPSNCDEDLYEPYCGAMQKTVVAVSYIRRGVAVVPSIRSNVVGFRLIRRGAVAIPFTTKGYYVCRLGFPLSFVQSCRVGHVWNDKQKQCVRE